jgi:hypothetical protein
LLLAMYLCSELFHQRLSDVLPAFAFVVVSSV